MGASFFGGEVKEAQTLEAAQAAFSNYPSFPPDDRHPNTTGKRKIYSV
jgi:hypothetical protein